MTRYWRKISRWFSRTSHWSPLGLIKLKWRTWWRSSTSHQPKYRTSLKFYTRTSKTESSSQISQGWPPTILENYSWAFLTACIITYPALRISFCWRSSSRKWWLRTRLRRMGLSTRPLILFLLKHQSPRSCWTDSTETRSINCGTVRWTKSRYLLSHYLSQWSAITWSKSWTRTLKKKTRYAWESPSCRSHKCRTSRRWSYSMWPPLKKSLSLPAPLLLPSRGIIKVHCCLRILAWFWALPILNSTPIWLLTEGRPKPTRLPRYLPEVVTSLTSSQTTATKTSILEILLQN